MLLAMFSCGAVPEMLTCPHCGKTSTLEQARLPPRCPHCQQTMVGVGLVRSAMAAGSRDDRAAVMMLLLVNIAVLAVAIVFDWSNRSLMLIYWAQSVVIGIGNFLRILGLRQFSTEGFKINGKAAEPNDQTRRSTAWFFLFHYGFFHLVYLVFIVADSEGASLFDWTLLLCVLAFVLEYLPEHRQQRAYDQSQVPNIGALMFTPYLRILPMHITIIFAFGQTDSTWGLLLFGSLKTVADVGMLMIGQAQRRKQPATAPTG